MMPNWLALIVVGLIAYVVSLAPVIPGAWRPFVQGVAGILVVVGVVILALMLLGVTVLETT